MIQPVIYKKEKLFLLDQRKLPFKEIYIEIKKFNQLLNAIKNMTVRGAPLIGITAGYGFLIGLEKILKRKDFKEVLKKRLSALENTRPTAYNLFYVTRRIRELVDKGIRDFKAYEDIAIKIHQEEIKRCEKIGKVGSKLIRKGMRVLTHCNTGALATGGIGTAFGVIYKARKKIKEVIFTETRPYFQGARLTSYELHKAKIPHRLIFDFEAGVLMKNRMVDIVITGADRIAKNGDTANKTGTLVLAVLANYFKIPFYIAAPVSTFDLNAKSGKDFVIEQRNPEEVKKVYGKRIAPDITKAIYYSFDITRSKLISGYITEKGVLKPPFRL